MVLKGVERAIWHKDKREVSRQRATKRDIEPKSKIEMIKNNGAGGEQKEDETAREES